MAIPQEEKKKKNQENKSHKRRQGKSPLIAVFLSAMVAGLGDLYAGSWIKAIVFFGVNIVCYILIFDQGLGYFVYAPVWFCGLVSAWMSATISERKTGSHSGEAISHQV
jgi:hypothetical protein